jgi:hypothetical protein
MGFGGTDLSCVGRKRGLEGCFSLGIGTPASINETNDRTDHQWVTPAAVMAASARPHIIGMVVSFIVCDLGPISPLERLVKRLVRLQLVSAER